MATKAVTDSSAAIAQAEAIRLTQDIMGQCVMVGEVLELDRIIGENQRNESTFPETVQKTMQLARRVDSLIEGVGKYGLTLSSEPVSSIDSFAQKFLTAQFDVFKEKVNNLKHNVQYTINGVIRGAEGQSEKLLPIFEKAVGQYLQTRVHKDSQAAAQIADNIGILIGDVRNLTEIRNRWADRKVEYNYQIDPIQERCNKLRELICSGYFYNNSCETVLFRLEEAMAGEDQVDLDQDWGVNKERMNVVIDQLHKEVGSDQVNYWVWKLSGEKPGKDYGLVHRYDDLRILKEAILCTTKSLANKIMKEEAVGLDQEAVFAKLYEIIGAPQVENPKAWMKENVGYYTQQLHAAIEEVKFPRRQFDIYGEDDFKSSPFSTGSMSISSQPIFFSSMPRIEPQKHEFTQIFEELAELDQEAIPSGLRARVEEMISKFTAKGIIDTINDEIWRLGGQKPDDNWGVDHRYDDANALRQALVIALKRDIHEKFLVEGGLVDEEDRNAFYAEIARIAFGFEGIPSSVDPIAYGRENIVFHLDQLGRARSVVMEQIEIRRQKKAHESEEALEGIIRAAIEKDPAAQSVADLLQSIDGANSAVEACKAQIREKVEGTDFAKDLRNQIFLGIWTANGKPLGDTQYGKKHYLDNLETLKQVLINILIEIGINNE